MKLVQYLFHQELHMFGLPQEHLRKSDPIRRKPDHRDWLKERNRVSMDCVPHHVSRVVYEPFGSPIQLELQVLAELQ